MAIGDSKGRGLESTEFVIAVENALGLPIPDGDFREARTPRDLVNYLVGRIPEVDPGFGTVGARWTEAEIGQVVEGLLAKASGRADFDFDWDFRTIFP
jgi:hypothetical protein